MSIPTRKETFVTVGGRPFLAHRVLDPAAGDILAAVRGMTMDTSGTSGTAAFRFPGPLPVSLERADLYKLKEQEYVACEKTDGARFALVCLVYGGLKIVVLVGRNGSVALFPLKHVPRAMFQGTVLDGELAIDKSTGAFAFVIFDAVVVSGVSVGHATLCERLRAVKAALTHYRPDPADPAGLVVKSYVSMRVPMLVKSHLDASAQRFDVDGVIFTPMNEPVVYGRHRGLFKLKTKHTVDFVLDGRGNLSVYDKHRRDHVVVGALAACTDDRVAINRPVVECAHTGGGDPSVTTWTLVTAREDKTTANDMETFQRTMLNMRESLSLDDVWRL